MNKQMIGKKFGRLTIIDRAENIGKETAWNCLCDCGNTKSITNVHLKYGCTKSCGCLHREMVSTHGMTLSSEYNSWSKLKDRCLNKNNDNYNRYGGRGITVCDRWLKFENFYADMGDRPSRKHSIDRKDNNGNYEPVNCRWVTWSVQNRNRGLDKRNISGLSGVVRVKNKWRATISYEGKNIHLYEGKDFFEACCRRRSAENKYWGVNR